MGAAAASADASPDAGRRFGPAVVEDELGRGGMGVVYRVRHEQTGVVRALKAILPGRLDADGRAVARFRREAQALARLDAHPQIVRIDAFGEQDGAVWVVMEYVEGRSLSARVKGDGPLPPAEAARIVARVARAIAFAHGHGILHRDLKPANVLIDGDGAPRVLDFGLALDQEAKERLTETGQIVGTPEYMAPEQLDEEMRAAGAIGPGADVYGLGATLYELLAGRPPFGGGPVINVIAAVLTAWPRPPSALAAAVPLELDAICLKALEKEPGARYATADALADDLERWLDGAPTEARPPGRLSGIVRRIVPARGPRRRARIALLSIAGAALVAATGAGVYVAWTAARRSAAARADAGRAERRARIEALIARVRERGERAALADAVAAADALHAAHGDEAFVGFAEMRRGLADLERLAAGDAVALRTLDLRMPRWDGWRETVLRVLGREPRHLAVVLEREPALLEPDVLPVIADDASVTLAPELARRILDRIDALALASRGDPDERARWLGMRRRLLLRRLGALLADDPIDIEQVAAALDRLLPALRAAPGEARLGAGALDRLVALTRRESERAGADGRTLTDLFEASMLLLPEEDGRARELVTQLLAEITIADVDRAFRIAVTLERLGASPAPLDNLGRGQRDPGSLAAREEELIRGGVERLDPVELYVIAANLLDREQNALREDGAVKSAAYRRALLARWPAVRVLGEVERERPGELPAMIASWIAEMLDEAFLVREEDREANEELRRRVVADLSALAGGDGDLRELIARIHRVAVVRQSALPTALQRPGVLRAWIAWLVIGESELDRAATRAEVKRILELAEPIARYRTGRVDWEVSRRRLDDILEATWEMTKKHLGDAACARGRMPEACALWRESLGPIASAAARLLPRNGWARLIEAEHLRRHALPDDAIALVDLAIADERAADDQARALALHLYQARLLHEAGRDADARGVLEATDRLATDGKRRLSDSDLSKRADVWALIGDDARAEADRAEAARRSGKR